MDYFFCTIYQSFLDTHISNVYSNKESTLCYIEENINIGNKN